MLNEPMDVALACRLQGEHSQVYAMYLLVICTVPSPISSVPVLSLCVYQKDHIFVYYHMYSPILRE
jgi:hypothetical protein